MKTRLSHWPSTVLGLALLVFLAYMVRLDRTLLQRPESLVLLGAGLFGLWMKPKDRA
jgi:hypothetical protein